MAVFTREDGGGGLWTPSPYAVGPFSGLQGGAIAGLLAAEIEQTAVEREFGEAVSVSAWFLRPTRPWRACGQR